MRRAAPRTTPAADNDRSDQRDVRQSAGRAELADGRPAMAAGKRPAISGWIG